MLVESCRLKEIRGGDSFPAVREGDYPFQVYVDMGLE